MFTPDPHSAHEIAAAREKLQSQLIYLENALKNQPAACQAPIYGLLFSVIEGRLHYEADPNCGMPTEYGITEAAYRLLNTEGGLDAEMMNDTAQAIMNWFTNPIYQ